MIADSPSTTPSPIAKTGRLDDFGQAVPWMTILGLLAEIRDAIRDLKPGETAPGAEPTPAVETTPSLRSLRLASGLTVKQLADKIGTAHSGPASWENARYGPSPKQIPKLAKALEVSPHDVRRAVLESARLAKAKAAASPR